MLLFSLVKSGTLNLEWWCQFLHTKAKIYSDVDYVRGEIERETDRMAGLDNKKISLSFHFCKKIFQLPEGQIDDPLSERYSLSRTPYGVAPKARRSNDNIENNRLKY